MLKRAKNSKPTLLDIKRALRKGTRPAKIRTAKRLGRGAQRTAWRIGDYVVKANTVAWKDSITRVGLKHYPRGTSDPDDLKNTAEIPAKVLHVFKRVRVEAPRQYAVKTWIIQEYLRPITSDRYYRHMDSLPPKAAEELDWGPYDLHAGNIGMRKNGTLVAFDW